MRKKKRYPVLKYHFYLHATFTSQKPRSCFDHLWIGARFSGYYYFDNEGQSFPVYCDLTSDSTAAWTLFMSEKTPGLGVFQASALYIDKPKNEDNPNWNLYRMSLSKMKQLRSRSSHWRVTCSFQTDGVVYRDYVRAKIADFDPIDFIELKKCKRVEYINVRGHSCADCDVAWWQNNNQMLHYDSSSIACGWDASSGAVASEDNFGFYVSSNPNFRCTKPADSTTNYWFGSYLKWSVVKQLTATQEATARKFGYHLLKDIRNWVIVGICESFHRVMGMQTEKTPIRKRSPENEVLITSWFLRSDGCTDILHIYLNFSWMDIIWYDIYHCTRKWVLFHWQSQ